MDATIVNVAMAANVDFTTARPLWLACAGLGVVVTVLAVVSTSPRAVRSEERLAPLRRQEPAHVG
jgi:hypothetical protein